MSCISSWRLTNEHIDVSDEVFTPKIMIDSSNLVHGPERGGLPRGGTGAGVRQAGGAGWAAAARSQQNFIGSPKN